MKTQQLFFSLLLCSLFVPHVSWAKVVSIDEVEGKKEAIQLGAFRESKVNLLLSSLPKKYDIFLAKESGILRVFVVNIKEEAYGSVLSELEKDHPGLFRGSNRVRYYLSHKKREVTPQSSRPHPMVTKEIIPPYPLKTKLLNTQTILETRRKFF